MATTTSITALQHVSCMPLSYSEPLSFHHQRMVKPLTVRFVFEKFTSLQWHFAKKQRLFVQVASGKDNSRITVKRNTVCLASTVDNADSSSVELHTKQALVNGRRPFPVDGIEPHVLLSHNTITGGSIDFERRSSNPLFKLKTDFKRVFLVRHGLSSWNEEGRVQGSSDLSILSEKGINQVQRCKEALSRIKFDVCFTSPISRAKSSAEHIWSGRKEPIIFVDNLKEANLLCLEGMLNSDAKAQYPELFRTWREDPANFHIDGVYPVVQLWEQARKAWEDILSCTGEQVLVVTHKSMLRALICTTLGMSPASFRTIDINNTGVSTFFINKHGNPMLQNLNMTAHLYVNGMYY